MRGTTVVLAGLLFCVPACDQPVEPQPEGAATAGPALVASAGRHTIVVNPNASGNGVAATIQEGIDMAAEGGRVQIRPGTYDEVLTISHGVTLEPIAGGAGEVILAPTDASAPAVLVLGSGPVVLRGFQVRHVGASGIRATGTTDLILDGMTVVTGPPASSGNAVASVNDPALIDNYTGGRARLTVRNTLIDGNQASDVRPHVQGFGIRVGGEVDAVIVGNRIVRAGGACIFVLPRIDLTGVTNADIMDNDLDQCFPQGRVSSILVGAGVPLPSPLPPVTFSGAVNLVGNTIRNSTVSCEIASAISYEAFTGRIEHNRIQGFVLGCAPPTARNRQGAIWVGTLLALPGTAAPTVRFNDLGGNAWAGLRIAPNLTTALDASCNWWGASDGPSGIGAGSGDAILVDGAAPLPAYTPYATAPIAGTGAAGC